ncbi:hypothetical protein DPMN_091537 [Dreissena polymorpha]|uniref:Uncharacterized protein n=1 Tax=Dreissena polymorpha TaxID=45954 RepID=A0A9D4L010_DREPO|nr:hypothetical protein DPMN_091537 [Dreissena polymorpha]
MGRQRPTRIPTPHVNNGAIVEIDRIVIRYVQYQFEGAPGLVMGPCIIEIDRIVIRDVQYEFEVNRCRNEEVIRGLCGRGAPGLVMGPCIVEINRIVIRDVQYQFAVNGCRNEEVNKIVARTDGRTDGQTAEIITISPRFSKSVGIIIKKTST